MKTTDRVSGRLRQLLYPREFRIPVLPWQGELVAALQQLTTATGSTPSPREEAGPDPRFLAEVGTGLWRLRQRMVEPGTDRPVAEMRRAFRHLESVMDVMAEAGVEIQDHTDDPFDAGLSLQVIAFQPTPGVQRERVAETIKPTVYLEGRMIQMGEVFVASPERGDVGEGG